MFGGVSISGLLVIRIKSQERFFPRFSSCAFSCEPLANRGPWQASLMKSASTGTGPLLIVRKWGSGPGWVSYLRKAVYHKNFITTAPEFLILSEIQG